MKEIGTMRIEIKLIQSNPKENNVLPFIYVVNLLYKDNPPDLVLLFMRIALQFASCFFFSIGRVQAIHFQWG